MSRFHEVRFPDNIAYRATGGPEFATTVVATGSGHEKRNVNWAQARGRWDVASRLKKQAQIDELIAFFRARRGRAYGPMASGSNTGPYKAAGQLLGTGDDVRDPVLTGQALPLRERDRDPYDRQAAGRHGEGVPGRRRAALGLVRRYDDRARHLRAHRRRSGSIRRSSSALTMRGGTRRDFLRFSSVVFATRTVPTRVDVISRMSDRGTWMRLICFRQSQISRHAYFSSL